MFVDHPYALYFQHLRLISDKKFTIREVDIISCITCGRSVTISTFLSISPNTVSSHITKILHKISGNSREDIINFVEKSNHYDLIKKYYECLLKYFDFERAISALRSTGYTNKKLKHARGNFKEDLLLVRDFEKHLTLLGCNISFRKELLAYKFVEYIKNNPEESLLLLLPQEEIDLLANEKHIRLFVLNGEKFGILEKNYHVVIASYNAMDIRNNIESYQDNKHGYYFTLGHILEKKSHANHESIDLCQQFAKRFIDFNPSIEGGLNHRKKQNSRDFYKFTKYGIVGFVCFLLLIIPLSLHKFSDGSYHQIESDLFIPSQLYLLKRMDLVRKVDDSFREQSHLENIPVIVIAGMGGAGKTIFTRYYCKSQKAPILWEINAESKDTLIRSFKNLMYALALTKDQQNETNFIQDIKDTEEQEKQIMLFVKRQLKKVKGWILIYDNLEDASCVKNHFPHDSSVWGEGRVVITTRNHNLKEVDFLNVYKTVIVDELSAEESLILFGHLFYRLDFKDISLEEKEKAKNFLEKIPHFPLDISVSACYLKNIGISFEEYLNHLECMNKDFERTQQELMKDHFYYNQTRKNIISLSFKRILNNNQSYQAPLFLIGMMNAANIPKDILKYFKSPFHHQYFLNYLNQYSLISNHKDDSFSIHRTTQHFLRNSLNLEDYKNKLDLFNSTFDIIYLYYVDRIRNNFTNGLIFLPHAREIEKHLELLENQTSNHINPKIFLILGDLYFTLVRDFLRALKHFEKAYHSHSPNLTHLDNAELFQKLGEIHLEINNLDQAMNYAQKSLNHAKHVSDNKRIILQNFRVIGSAHMFQNNYDKAEDSLKKALLLVSSENSEDTCVTRIKADIYASLSALYSKFFFNHKKARDSLSIINKSISTINQAIAKNHFHSAILTRELIKAFIRLGDIYCRLSSYEEAQKNGYQKALDLLQETGKEHRSKLLDARIISGQADIQVATKNFKVANVYLSKALELFRSSLSPDSELIRMTHLKQSLVRLHLGDLDGFMQDSKHIIPFSKKQQTNELKFIYAFYFYILSNASYKKQNFKKSCIYMQAFLDRLKELRDSLKSAHVNSEENIYNTLVQQLEEDITIFRKNTSDVSLKKINKLVSDLMQKLDLAYPLFIIHDMTVFH